MSIDLSVQGVFDKAMYLIDAQNESTGSTDNSDTTEYKVRTLGILNNLIDDAYPASDTFAIGEDGKRPALDDLTSFSDEIRMDPYIVRSVLPCGLAAKLLSEENPTLADFFWQLYEQRLAKARAGVPASFESIEDGLPYGGIEYGEFARWW
jgi:hypothetical protein